MKTLDIQMRQKIDNAFYEMEKNGAQLSYSDTGHYVFARKGSFLASAELATYPLFENDGYARDIQAHVDGICFAVAHGAEAVLASFYRFK